jgi:hypothetical protein
VHQGPRIHKHGDAARGDDLVQAGRGVCGRGGRGWPAPAALQSCLSTVSPPPSSPAHLRS